MTDNVEIIRRFISDWSTLDATRLAEYFTEDGSYHNMPIAPVAGKAAVSRFIAGFIASWETTQWDLLNIVGAGDLVIAERLDRTTTSNGNVDLPCVGVFEMEQGKIKVWRDYFDMATFTAAMK